jgi:hypothetical protein
MPDAREWLEYFYGHFFDGENVNYASPPDVDMALAVGNDFRPACLPTDRQNQAQAHYAAYVLEFRNKVKAANLSVSSAMQAVISGPAIEIQEGSTRVKYSEKASSSSSSGSVQQIQSDLTGPGTAYAAWFSLWSICALMGLDPITGLPGSPENIVPVANGGIITRFGYPP